jgi:peptidoglycan-associated lipoprotein
MVTLLMVLPTMVLLTSCAKKGVVTETQVDQAAIDAEKARQEELARQRALEEERLRQEQLLAQQAQQEMEIERNRFINEDIYFEFDKSQLLPAAQEVLRSKADWLRANPDATAIIEGHCDERGTNEYNLALGDRRAESAKGFLVDLGIAGSRLTTISYGEERPVDPAHNEQAWAMNRRAHFVVE